MGLVPPQRKRLQYVRYPSEILNFRALHFIRMELVV